MRLILKRRITAFLHPTREPRGDRWPGFLETARRSAEAQAGSSVVPPPELPVFEFPPAAPPSSLREKLDPVIGQGRAKDLLTVLFSMHLARCVGQRAAQSLPSAILIGPTGVGKTHSMRTLATAVGLPFVTADATALVPAGIVGYQIEDIMLALYRRADTQLRLGGYRRKEADILAVAERGVLFIDEFDKLATRGGLFQGGDTNSARAVQRRLLKLLEGDFVRVGVKYRDEEQPKDAYIDTSKLLIIVGGAFANIEKDEYVGQRAEPGVYKQLGIPEGEPVSEDITHYGFIPELVARLPIIVRYGSLEPGDLALIMHRPEVSPLEVWRWYLKDLGIAFEFDDEAVVLLAGHAARLKMGARALPQLLFPYLADRLVNQQGNDTGGITVTSDDLQSDSLIYRRRRPEEETE
jgi:ATP-dependent Clp protease ATP-binding subunit ClpX